MESLENLLSAAVAAHNKGDIAQAERQYLQILTQHPNSAACLHNLGLLRLGAGQLSEAVSMIKRAILLAPKEEALKGTIRTLGLTLHSYGLWEEALPWLRQVVEDNSADSEVNAILARITARDYLEPEIYDPLQQTVLQRYSPRESDSYIYTIDIVGTCNLRCPTCPVGNFAAAERSKGFMTISLFKEILAKIDKEKITDRPTLNLFNWGEPLLHPELHQFIELAHAYELPVSLSSNLNIKTDLEKMVQAQPESLKISLSGFTEDTYRLTHVRGKITLVKSNMKLLRQLMNKHDSNMKVFVGHHIYKHNVDEINEVKAFCEELNFTHAPIQAFFQPLEKVRDAIEGVLTSDELPVLDLLQLHPRERFEKLQQTRTTDFDCELRFNQTVINYDGQVALCCSVYDKENMLNKNFLEASHAELDALKYQHEFCTTCKKNHMDYAPSVLNKTASSSQ